MSPPGPPKKNSGYAPPIIKAFCLSPILSCPPVKLGSDNSGNTAETNPGSLIESWLLDFREILRVFLCRRRSSVVGEDFESGQRIRGGGRLRKWAEKFQKAEEWIEYSHSPNVIRNTTFKFLPGNFQRNGIFQFFWDDSILPSVWTLLINFGDRRKRNMLEILARI